MNPIKTTLLAAGLLAAAGAASAEQFPSKPITLIVPWPAGGLSDIMARTLQPFLAQELGEPIVVVNKVGGGAAIGMAALIHAEPDGHTIGMIHEPPLAAHTIKGTAPYSLDQLSMLGLVNYDAAALAVPKDSGFESFEDFKEAWASGEVKVGVPGGRLTSDDSIAYFLLADAAGIDREPVPFQGFGPLETAFAGGHVEAVVSNVGLFANRPDLYRVLVVLDDERTRYFPEVPTAAEQGYDVAFGAWRGLGTSSEVPEATLETLRAALARIAQDPEAQAAFEGIKAPLSYASGPEFEAQLDSGAERQRKLLETVGSN